MNMLLRTSSPFDSNNNKKTPESSSSFSSSSSQSDEEEVTYLLASSKPKKRAGRRVFKETRHPVYRGVRRRNGNKWVCEMRVPNSSNNSRIWLGTYPTPEMAARAHDVAVLALRGKSSSACCLNFADSAWRLQVPDSTNAEDIRKAAVEAAKAFAATTDENNNNNKNKKLMQQQESVMMMSTVIDQHEEVCSMGMEDGNDDNKGNNEDTTTLKQEIELEVGVPQYEDFHDLIMSIADEPLRSPTLPFARDAAASVWGWNNNDVDILDNNSDDMSVSLWSFSF